MKGGRRGATSRRKPTRVGVSTGTFVANQDSATMDALLDGVVTLGGKWVRETMAWPTIQSVNSSTFNWTAWDLVVSKCNSRGLHLIPIILGSPTWARPTTYASGTAYSPPDSPSTLATFCTAAVTRYKASIHHWEIWNEPNLTSFWGGFTPSAANYYGLLSAAYTAIKAADPTCTVISAGMGSAAVGSGLSPPEWLDAIIVAGAGTKCDGYGHHPYSYPLLPSNVQTFNPWSQIADTTPSLVSVMNTRSAVKPLWLTEVGAPTYGPGPAATRANHYGVDIYPPLPAWNDEQTCADICAESINLARANPGRFACLLWYSLLDSGIYTYSPSQNLSGDPAFDRETVFGLYRQNSTQKPSATQFTARIAATGGQA